MAPGKSFYSDPKYPYVPTADPHLRQGDVRHEPVGALQSGGRGLDDLRRIVAGAPAFLAPAGWLLVEHGYDQNEAVRALFEQQQFQDIQQKQDIAGLMRVTLGRR